MCMWLATTVRTSQSCTHRAHMTHTMRNPISCNCCLFELLLIMTVVVLERQVVVVLAKATATATVMDLTRRTVLLLSISRVRCRIASTTFWTSAKTRCMMILRYACGTRATQRYKKLHVMYTMSGQHVLVIPVGSLPFANRPLGTSLKDSWCSSWAN